MNRLDGSQSPYLRFHSDQPVDWYPWGEEAVADAAYLAQAASFGDKLGGRSTFSLTLKAWPTFWATYFPPVRKMKQPSFLVGAKTLSRAWSKKRGEILASTQSLKEAWKNAALKPNTTCRTPPSGWLRRTTPCSW